MATNTNKNQVTPPASPFNRILHASPIWGLVAGVAIGFAVAREMDPRAGTTVVANSDEAVPSMAQPLAAAPTPSPSPTPAAIPSAGVRKLDIPAWSPRKGPKAAKVNVIAFSDFECPFCSRAVPVMHDLESKFGKEVTAAFINLPLPFHKNATIAAQAGLAANRQGKFWEFHDKMFANQQMLDRASLEKYAGELKLNMERFKRDIDDAQVKAQVSADEKLAASVGATGTPTFFVNGRKVVGAKPFEEFQTMINEEIKKADDLVKKGTPLAQVASALTMTNLANTPGEPPPPAAKVQIAAGNAPSKGPASAAVTIIEFSEFQCPFCAKVGPTMKQIQELYKGKVRIAFKHNPLPFHNNAQIAAEASLAAHEQGKFWQMHDKMFENQQALDRPSLEKYAEELNLDMKKFKAALDTGKFKDQVTADQNLAKSVGAGGTPTFFVNGNRLVGAQPFEAFKKIIDEELASKS